LLRARLDAGPAAAPEVERAWRALHRSGGRARTDALTRIAGCGPRRLITLFRNQVGTTPKAAAQVLRYARAARLLTGGTSPATAATCGYADQAQLTREIRRYAGPTPRQI
jgi:transcriptional regulator GlxA family with amidase domain